MELTESTNMGLLESGDLEIVLAVLRTKTNGRQIRKGHLWTILEKNLPARFNAPVIAEVLRCLQECGIVAGQFAHGMRPLTNVSLALPEEERPENVKMWQQAILSREDNLSRIQFDALMCAPSAVLSLNPADQAALIEGLLSLSEAVRNGTLADTYITSAKFLLGSSKALDIVGTQVASAFGIPAEASLNRIQHVLTAGPDDGRADTVLIIENMAAFSAFAGSETRNQALAICSFGYGLSMENLGLRLKVGGLRSCPAVGPRYALAEILASAQCILFWGDLDREGLRIYASLRSAIPGLRLSAAYGLMEAELRRGNSHPYGSFAGKSTDQRSAALDDPALFTLLEAVKDRAVDQEAVCDPWPGEIVLHPYAQSASGENRR